MYVIDIAATTTKTATTTATTAAPVVKYDDNDAVYLIEK